MWEVIGWCLVAFTMGMVCGGALVMVIMHDVVVNPGKEEW